MSINSLEDAIGIICQEFLVPEPEGEGMTADQVIDELLGTFLTFMEQDELRFFVHQKMKNIHGYRKRNKKNVYKCTHRFDLGSAAHLMPSRSDEFRDAYFLDRFHTGSTLVFERRILGEVNYFHTGMLLRGRKGFQSNVLLELSGSYFPPSKFQVVATIFLFTICLV